MPDFPYMDHDDKIISPAQVDAMTSTEIAYLRSHMVLQHNFIESAVESMKARKLAMKHFEAHAAMGKAITKGAIEVEAERLLQTLDLSVEGTLADAVGTLHEVFLSLIAGGFTENQALRICSYILVPPGAVDESKGDSK